MWECYADRMMSQPSEMEPALRPNISRGYGNDEHHKLLNIGVRHAWRSAAPLESSRPRAQKHVVVVCSRLWSIPSFTHDRYQASYQTVVSCRADVSTGLFRTLNQKNKQLHLACVYTC